MKINRVVFSILGTVLVAFSNSATADWFDGWNNANTQGSGTGNASGWGTGSGDGSTSGQGNVSGWGTGKGDADGEVDFSLKFKGKGRTDMDTKMSGDGQTDFAGNVIGDTTAAGNTAGNVTGQGSGSNENGYSGNPWNSRGYSGGYSGGNNNYGYGMPQPGYSMMPAYPQQIPQMQMMPYAYPAYGYNPQMMAIPAMPPQLFQRQAPSYQEVVKRQEAMRKQMQAQMQQMKNSQKVPGSTPEK